MDISERELNAMTRDLEEAHHGALQTMREAIEEVVEESRRPSTPGAASRQDRLRLGRRGFLVGAGVVGGGLVLAACGSSSKSSSGASTTTTSPATTPTSAAGGAATDLAVATLAVGLENLAVQSYGKAGQAASAGKLGQVPPAVVNFVQTVAKQHQDHADAWNAVLQKAGKPKVTGVDQTVDQAVVQPALAKAATITDAANLALQLEDVAAATYLSAIQNELSETSAIKLAATIQPVEMQHAAVLLYVLGKYPVPDAFAPTTGARSTTDKVA